MLQTEKLLVVRRSFKIGALKNFANFTGNILCWSHFFNKVAGLEKSVTLSKRDSSKGVFL